MKNLVGFRLREGRLRKNLSQEGLCKGICAVSYLSKIEQGRVEPGPDIVCLLFARLGVKYENDPVFLEESRALLQETFEKLFCCEDCTAEAAALSTRGPRLLQSPLCLEYRIAQTWLGCSDGAQECTALTPFADYMSNDTRFLYELLRVWYESEEGSMEALRRAEGLRPCSLVSQTAADYLFQQGKYQEALRYCTQGYARAAEEGCVPIMRKLSFIEGLCYANLFHHPLMLRAFERTAQLSSGDEKTLASINYNIGASFLEKGRYTEALPLLLHAEQQYLDPCLSFSQEDRCLVCHKLAICCLELKQTEEARSWLEQAKRETEGLPEIYSRMLQLVGLRFRENYNFDDAYFNLLQELCSELDSALHHGYRQFHALFLMEALSARRRYREAYLLARELNPMFSQN